MRLRGVLMMAVLAVSVACFRCPTGFAQDPARAVFLAEDGALVVAGWAGHAACIVDCASGATSRVWIASACQRVVLPWPVRGRLCVLIDQASYVINDRDAMWD